MKSSTRQKRIPSQSLFYQALFYLGWGFILAAFCLMVSFAGMEKFYVGRTVVQLWVGLEPPGDLPMVWTPETLRREDDLIRTNETLLHVVETLQLAKKWNLSPEAAADKLRPMIEVRLQHDTQLLEIEVYTKDLHEAAELANAVERAYEEHRRRVVVDLVVLARDNLEKELEDRDRLEEAARKKLAEVLSANGILNFGEGVADGNVSDSTDVILAQASYKKARADNHDFREAFFKKQFGSGCSRPNYMRLHEEAFPDPAYARPSLRRFGEFSGLLILSGLLTLYVSQKVKWEFL